MKLLHVLHNYDTCTCHQFRTLVALQQYCGLFYVISVTTFGTILAGKCIMCRSAGLKCFGPKECSRFAVGWFSNAQQPPGPSRYGTPCYRCSCNYSSTRHVIEQVNWTELVYFLTVNN